MTNLRVVDENTVVVDISNRAFSISSDRNPVALASEVLGFEVIWELPEYDETLDQFMAKLLE